MPLNLWKMSAIFATILLLLGVPTNLAFDNMPPPCDSSIYCYGPLLKTVQLSGIFNDSKHFVDMSQKHSPEITLKNFALLMNKTDNHPTQDEIRAYVEDNFLEPSTEFVSWNPPDWNDNPEFIKKIVDPDLEAWAMKLNDLWKLLGRMTSDEVAAKQDQYSLLYLPKPVMVPGGRFREVYYWDSYWTIEGLLLSGMHLTVRGMLENFADLIRKYGMIPNGGRIYYTRRTQPPYFISMVKLYVDYTNDIDFVRTNIDLLEKEFNFWEKERVTHVRDTKTNKVHSVLQYKVLVAGPRPESYKEDYELAQNLTSEAAKENLYVQLKSGAESGWDYSTRWFVKGDSNKGDLSDLNVTAIAPVDLNSLLCRNARILSEFYEMLGENENAVKYNEIAMVRNQTLADLFWDEEDGIWYDLNIVTMKKRKFFYLSNVHPIWSGCYGTEGKREKTLEKAIKYLKNKDVIDYIGGVPTSLKKSGQQWDFPNAWAPLQHLVIMGLYNARNLSPEAEPLSFELAEKWVKTNYLGYKATEAMFEKYDVTVEGVAGGGGEYNVQLGFGWTNGVAMKFLDTFGDRLTATTGGSTRRIDYFSMAFFLPFVLMLLLSSLRGL